MEVPDCGAIYENPGTQVPYLTLRLFLIGSGGNPEHSASGVTETVPPSMDYENVHVHYRYLGGRAPTVQQVQERKETTRHKYLGTYLLHITDRIDRKHGSYRIQAICNIPYITR